MSITPQTFPTYTLLSHSDFQRLMMRIIIKLIILVLSECIFHIYLFRSMSTGYYFMLWIVVNLINFTILWCYVIGLVIYLLQLLRKLKYTHERDMEIYGPDFSRFFFLVDRFINKLQYHRNNIIKVKKLTKLFQLLFRLRTFIPYNLLSQKLWWNEAFVNSLSRLIALSTQLLGYNMAAQSI